jgi:hypothetical protein
MDTMIQDLLPPSAYVDADRAYGPRAALGMAAFWGVSMYLIDHGSNVLRDVAITAVFALAFGFSSTWMMRSWARRAARRGDLGRPRTVPTPPAGEYDYQLACGYLAEPKRLVAGHLYLGRKTWTFVPERRELLPEPLSFSVVPAPRVEAVDADVPTPVSRILGRRLLRVHTPERTATFFVLKAEAAAARVREYLQSAPQSA